MPLQLRRGTNAQRQSMTEPLAAGELIYVTDTGTIYVGNGTTLGGIPVVNLTAADIKPISAEVFTAGSHTGISFTYNVGTQTIDAVVNPDLSNYQGTIRADSFQGSVFGEDSTQLVNAIDGSINLDGTVKGDIIPDQNEAHDIGSASNRFGDLYLSGSSLHLGDAVITSTGTAVNLPSGSTVGGIAIGSAGGEGVVPGSNYNINIVSDTSTLIVDSSTGTINGDTFGYHTGDVRGSVVGDDSRIIIDSSTGTINGDTFGYHTGDVKGSVVGDDSTIIIDGINNTIRTTNLTFSGTNISSNTNEIFIGSTVDDQQVVMYSGERNFFELYGIYDPISELGPWIDLRVSEGTMDSPTATNDQTVLSGLLCYGHDGTDYIQTSALAFKVNGTTSVGAVPAEFFVVCESDTIGSPSVLSFTGNQGILTAPIFKTGTYANDTARDAAIPAPQAGMLIFNQRDDSTGVPQFQGYDGTNWVDLH